MKRLTNPETSSLLREMGIEIIGRKRLVFSSHSGAPNRLTIPSSSRGIAIMANLIIQALIGARSIIIAVTQWGVWASEESWTLFARAMAGYGDTRTLKEAPTFLFGPDEMEDARDVLRFAASCGWDAAIVGSEQSIGFVITHDEDLFATGDANLVTAWSTKFSATLGPGTTAPAKPQ